MGNVSHVCTNCIKSDACKYTAYAAHLEHELKNIFEALDYTPYYDDCKLIEVTNSSQPWPFKVILECEEWMEI